MTRKICKPQRSEYANELDHYLRKPNFQNENYIYYLFLMIS